MLGRSFAWIGSTDLSLTDQLLVCCTVYSMAQEGWFEDGCGPAGSGTHHGPTAQAEDAGLGRQVKLCLYLAMQTLGSTVSPEA